MEAAEAALNEFTSLVDDIIFCQPFRADIFKFYQDVYHCAIVAHVSALFGLADQQGIPELLRMVHWVGGYQHSMARLGAIDLKPRLQDKLGLLLEAYGQQMLSLMMKWADNILNSQPQQQSDSDHASTTVPVDLFRLDEHCSGR